MSWSAELLPAVPQNVTTAPQSARVADRVTVAADRGDEETRIHSWADGSIHLTLILHVARETESSKIFGIVDVAELSRRDDAAPLGLVQVLCVGCLRDVAQ